MSRQKYPQSMYARYPLREQGECECCAKPATTLVAIRWGYMSDDKDTIAACERHNQMYGDSFDRFMAHYHTKDKHIEKQGTAK